MCMSVAQSCLTLCDPTDCTDQALRSMGFSRQEHWTGLPCPSPEDLPDVEIEPRCPALQAASLPSELQGSPALLLILCRGVYCGFNLYSPVTDVLEHIFR